MLQSEKEVVMILFDKDWQEQGAVIHYSTCNQSFIKMHILLKRMGIKNNTFFLSLTQPELAKYNPHHLTDNSVELRQKIALECKINYWYYIRECVRVPVSGKPPGPYIVNRANLALAWLFLCCVDVFLTMPRQIGKTIGTMVLTAWHMYLAGQNMNIGLFARNGSLSMENVDRLKFIRDNLPKYLVYQTPADTNNKEGVSYAQLATTYKTFIAQMDKIRAQEQGKGETFVWEHWDEFPFYANSWLSYVSAVAATNRAQEQAQNSGLGCSNIITTTAGDLSTEAGRYAYGIKTDAMRFNERLYDAIDKEHLHSLIKAGCSNNAFMAYCEFSYKQLGESEEWFKRVTRNKDKGTIERDYLNIWQSGGEEAVLPKHLVDRMAASVIDPITCTFYESLMIRWFVDPDLVKSDQFKDRPYIMGCDTSDNVGLDFTTLILVDPSDLTVVATCKCNLANLAFVAKLVVEIMTWFPRSIFIPERNKNGAFLLDLIILALQTKHIDPIRRIYNTYIQDYTDLSPKLSSLDLSSGLVRKHFGFTTSGDTRSELYGSVLMTLMELMADRISDADIFDQARGLIVRNGRIDHSSGSHDDLLISLLLVGYFIIYGRNLYLYGIKREEFLTSVDESTGEHIDPLEKERMLRNRKRIKQIEETLPHCTSVMIKAALQRELNHLKSITKEEPIDAKVVSVEQMAAEREKENSAIDFANINNTNELLLKLF